MLLLYDNLTNYQSWRKNTYYQYVFFCISIQFYSQSNKELINSYKQACRENAIPIFKQKIDRDCKLLLNQAKNAWNSGLNFEAAQNAAFFLDQIEPSSSCFNEVNQFYNTVQQRLKKIDKREWDFILQKQEDFTNIAVQNLKNFREVALANAQNQPESISYNVNGWW